MAQDKNATWAFILRIVSYVATAIAGMLGGSVM